MLAFRKASEVALEVPAYQQICEKEKLKQRRCCKLLNMRKVRLRRQIEKLEKVTHNSTIEKRTENVTTFGWEGSGGRAKWLRIVQSILTLF